MISLNLVDDSSYNSLLIRSWLYNDVNWLNFSFASSTLTSVDPFDSILIVVNSGSSSSKFWLDLSSDIITLGSCIFICSLGISIQLLSIIEYAP